MIELQPRSVYDERGFAGNLAATDPAGEGAALRDHDEDTKSESCETTVNPCDVAFYNNCLCLVEGLRARRRPRNSTAQLGHPSRGHVAVLNALVAISSPDWSA